MPQNYKTSVIYRHKAYSILCKSPGMSVQGGGKDNQGHLLTRFRELDLPPRAVLVHRLDKATSGIIALANHAGHSRALHKCIREGEKKYLCVAKGKIGKPYFVISQKVHEGKGDFKSAETRFKVLARFHKFTLLEAQLITGRKHQIRLHLKSFDHPILGDDKYGDFDWNREHSELGADKSLFLHAWQLKIKWPGERPRRFKADLPPHMQELLEKYNVKW